MAAPQPLVSVTFLGFAGRSAFSQVTIRSRGNVVQSPAAPVTKGAIPKKQPAKPWSQMGYMLGVRLLSLGTQKTPKAPPKRRGLKPKTKATPR